MSSDYSATPELVVLAIWSKNAQASGRRLANVLQPKVPHLRVAVGAG